MSKVLAVVETDPFMVYTAKKYPGVVRKWIGVEKRQEKLKTETLFLQTLLHYLNALPDKELKYPFEKKK